MKFIPRIILFLFIIAIIGCEGKVETNSYTLQVQTKNITVVLGNGHKNKINDEETVSMILENINENTYQSISFPESVGGFTLYFDDGWKYSSQGYLEMDDKIYKASNQKAVERINDLINN